MDWLLLMPALFNIECVIVSDIYMFVRYLLLTMDWIVDYGAVELLWVSLNLLIWVFCACVYT